MEDNIINNDGQDTIKTAEDYKNDFLIRRAKYAKATYNKGSIEIEDIYANGYVDECTNAASGDVVAQDLLSYWFKHGTPALPENIDLSMKWLFLAGSNGNKHSIVKLAMFFNYAYDFIIYCDYYDALKRVLSLDKSNYQEILGEIICKHLVEELNINALSLAKERTDSLEYNELSMQRFTKALNKVLPKLDDYFINFLNKYAK